MRKRLVLNVFAAILVLLSITQIIIDWRYEANFSERLQETVKHPEFNIFIEIEDKTLYLLQDGKCIKRFPIAAGLPEWPSPLGYWRIVNKGDWGEGFGGSWMGLNVTWGTFHQEHMYNPSLEGVLKLVGYPYAAVFANLNLVNQLLQKLPVKTSYLNQ